LLAIITLIFISDNKAIKNYENETEVSLKWQVLNSKKFNKLEVAVGKIEIMFVVWLCATGIEASPLFQTSLKKVALQALIL